MADGIPIPALAGFLLALVGPVAVFVAYPLALALAARCRRSVPAPGNGALPSVSLVTVVRNAAELAPRKVENALGLDYPRDRLEVVVFSDGSTDGTEARLQGYSPQGIRVFATSEHRGKAHGLEAAAAACTGEILVFSDADALLEPDALRALVRPFADGRVGGVCGQRVIERDGIHLARAQESYVEFDSWVKRLEGRLGRITSNDGKLYAVRRECYRAPDPGATDDTFVSLGVIGQGHDFVFEPAARARICVPSRDADHELERRRRIVARSLRGIYLQRAVLNPLRFGWFALGLFINKVLRRLLPLSLALLFASTAWLAQDSSFFTGFLLLQGAGCLLAAGDPVLRRLGLRGPAVKLTSRAYYFCVGQLGTLLGLADFCRGRVIERWEPKKTAHAGNGSHPDPHAQPATPGVNPPPSGTDAFRVAYIMSRFPKLTETFVLYEILALERLGIHVDIYPLLRGREAVRHPDADRLAPRVRHQRLLSLAIVGANLACLARHPVTYLRTALECLAGTCGSLRFLAGALAFFPKAVWFAREMQRTGVRHVHAHFAHHPALAALVVHRLSGIPFSFTAHGSDLHTDQRMLDRKIGAAAFALTISDYNRAFIRERCGEAAAARVSVVRCGVDVDAFSPRPPAARSGPFLVLCIAALREVKGHRHLIEACRRLKERGVAFDCHLIGDGPLRGDLEERVAAADLGAHVALHGALARGDVLDWLARADVLVAPSIMDARGRREGIPVACMEAMASGLPVVASRISGIPELVEDGRTGLLFPPGDADALANVLAGLSRDEPLRRRLGGAGRAKVLAEYSLRTNAARLAGMMRGQGNYGKETDNH